MKEAFEKRGYRIHVQKRSDIPFAKGVGGRARPIAKALVPVSFHGCGVLEFIVLPHACPPLLPAGFLDFLRAKIDMANNVLLVGEGGHRVTMTRLPPGHRSIALIGKDPSDFKLDDDIANKFPSFVKKAARPSSERWTREGDVLTLWHDRSRRALVRPEDLTEVP
eukprot:9444404-Pyramimonas_sp.AAC.1